MRRISILLIHISFLLICIGGICTACLARRGMMHLYPGEKSDTFIFDDNRVGHLPISLTLAGFEIERYPGSSMPRDYRSVLIGQDGDTLCVSMNHIGRLPDGYRLYQTDYDRYGGTWLSVSHDPVGTTIVYIGFALFMIGVICDLIHRMCCRHLRGAMIYSLGVTAICLCLCYVFMNPDKEGLLPVLATWWMPVHVGFAAAGYVVLASTIPPCIVALSCKSKRKLMIRTSLRLVAPGVLLLGIGIILGSLWANVSWGRYWGWDPKETWALITFVVYSIPLHKRLGLQKHPVALLVFILFSAFSIAMTYWGVNYLDSIHAYY